MLSTVFLEAANQTRRRTKRINREYKTEDTGLWAEPSIPHLSSSSSSSAASSADGREPGDHHRKDERRQSGKKRGSRSSSGSSAGSTACSSSSSSSQENHSGDRHCSGDREYSNQQVIHSALTFHISYGDCFCTSENCAHRLWTKERGTLVLRSISDQNFDISEFFTVKCFKNLILPPFFSHTQN